MAEVKPGPEHAMMAQDVGTWDATVTSYMSPTPEVSTAVDTRRMTANGMWMVDDFVGSMGGKPFVGHGVSGFDQDKKKFVGSWVDSMGSSLTTTEGTYNPVTKKATYIAKMSMGGQEMLSSMVTEYKDANNQTFTMSMPGPDGKQTLSLKIEYKRRK